MAAARVIDSDSHVMEVEETWSYLEPEFAARRPQVVHAPDAPQGSPVDAYWLVDGQLHPLDNDGTLGSAIVGPATIGPPDLDVVDPEDVDLCFSQWRVWAADAGVDPGPAPISDPPLEDDPLDVGGCSCQTPGGGGVWLGLVVVAWWPLRTGRSRKRAATTLTR